MDVLQQLLNAFQGALESIVDVFKNFVKSLRGIGDKN